MAKRLLIDEVDPNWRLPGDVDVDALTAKIAQAMENGSTIQVEIVMDNDPTLAGRVLINAELVRWIAVVDI